MGTNLDLDVVWEVVFSAKVNEHTFGTCKEHVTLSNVLQDVSPYTEAQATEKAKQLFYHRVLKASSWELEPIYARCLSPQQEEEIILESLWYRFPQVYLRHWMPERKGSLIITKAKKSLKTWWNTVWIR